jgi:Mg/Co/Ni transporter MgtE
MELDDLADLVGDLPEAVGAQLVKSMDAQDRERLNSVCRTSRTPPAAS